MSTVADFLDAIASACRGQIVVDATLKAAMVEAAEDTEVDESSEAAVFMGPPASSEAIAALEERCREVSGAKCPPELVELLSRHDGIWPRIELRGRAIDVAGWKPSAFDVSDHVLPVRSILTDLDFLKEQVTGGHGLRVALVPVAPIADIGWVGLDVREADRGLFPAVNVFRETMHAPDAWERVASSLGEWLHRWMQTGFSVWLD